jgi:hypothetical protein
MWEARKLFDPGEVGFEQAEANLRQYIENRDGKRRK